MVSCNKELPHSDFPAVQQLPFFIEYFLVGIFGVHAAILNLFAYTHIIAIVHKH